MMFEHMSKKKETQVPSAYVMASIKTKPIEKVRVLCEALMAVEEDEAERLQIIDRYYYIVVALDVEPQNPICLPFPFALTVENYEKYIKPWLRKMPDFIYRSDLERRIKLRALMNDDGSPKSEHEQFFTITSRLGLSRVSLFELQNQFAVWAVPSIMKKISKYVIALKRVLPIGDDKDLIYVKEVDSNGI